MTPLIDALLADEEVDVVAWFVNACPINFITDMRALPEADKPQFVEWTRLAFSPDRVRGEKAHHELIAYGTELARERPRIRATTWSAASSRRRWNGGRRATARWAGSSRC